MADHDQAPGNMKLGDGDAYWRIDLATRKTAMHSTMQLEHSFDRSECDLGENRQAECTRISSPEGLWNHREALKDVMACSYKVHTGSSFLRPADGEQIQAVEKFDREVIVEPGIAHVTLQVRFGVTGYEQAGQEKIVWFEEHLSDYIRLDLPLIVPGPGAWAICSRHNGKLKVECDPQGLTVRTAAKVSRTYEPGMLSYERDWVDTLTIPLPVLRKLKGLRPTGVVQGPTAAVLEEPKLTDRAVLLLRTVIAAGLPLPTLSISADPSAAADLATASYLVFDDSNAITAFRLTEPTCFSVAAEDKPLSLRTVYFMWQTRHDDEERRQAQWEALNAQLIALGEHDQRLPALEEAECVEVSAYLTARDREGRGVCPICIIEYSLDLDIARLGRIAHSQYSMIEVIKAAIVLYRLQLRVCTHDSKQGTVRSHASVP